ncbi:membrane alanyl aminopeptidase-like [Drosophila novamexicana]|uniref:membrane alanyl aminopeptidase-like n=1 Tax=Drosophila novamexicana TaxID=47314 RepID=UPI0011E58C05|nr:membrane alanyl aminopeptidase-like [Drosophila novamexicana]
MNSCRIRSWLLIALLSLAWIGSNECALNYRLEGSVVPIFYNLTIGLRGDADNPGTQFDGEVFITLKAVLADVKEITLHKDISINIEECSLYDVADQLVESGLNARLTTEEQTQQLTVPLAQSLAADANYTLYFKYTGKVQSDTVGLFSASYIDEATMKTKWVLLTQMQPINARLVFPCFDEPALKAKFEVHIGRPSGLSVVSNTELTKTTDEGNNRFTDHFKVTPIMSTYLLAFVVSEYQARGNSSLSILTRPAYYNYTEFSYSVAERVLPAFGELFQQSYQQLGNELLQYATTPRFPHNSMENWGLVIFKDKVVLEEPGVTDGWTQKEFTIRNIVHENAHMWLGNSVTCKWWSYIWLHEGFARYYEFFMGQELYPEYQLDQQFLVHKLHNALFSDSQNLTQPMTSPLESILTPADIDYKFDKLTFDKAASVIRMWRIAMGEENFNLAIQEFLQHYYLSSTSPTGLYVLLNDHWSVQESVLNQSYYDFTIQVGYPRIIVSLSLDDHMISWDQQRFLLNASDGSDPKLRYTVPITYTTNLAPNFQNLTPAFYLRKQSNDYNYWSDEPIDWVIVNLKQANYYRVFYNEPLLGRIQVALTKTDHSGIPVENRAAIIDDLFNFALAGLIDYVEVFEFMEYMSTETEYIPWYAAYVGMERIAKRLTPQQLPNFNNYLSDIAVTVLDKLGVGWNSGDKVLDVYNRNMQVAWLCKYQNPNCTNQVKELFEGGTEKPSPDYRETFYCAASRSGGYSRVLEYYAKETNYIDREIYWRAASCTRDYRTHYQNEILGKGNSVDLKIAGLAQLYEQNPDLVTPIFQMITEDIEQLAEALESWPKTAQALSDLADYFTTREQQQLFSSFYKESQTLFGSSAETLSQALATVDSNVQWAEQRLSKLVSFLAQRNGAAGLTLVSSLLMMMCTLWYLLLK